MFRQPGGTSRGIMYQREVYFITIYDDLNPNIAGIGECAPLKGLSKELDYSFFETLNKVISSPQFYIDNLSLLTEYPSIRFAIETAYLDFRHNGQRRFFPSEFTDGKYGMKINGLVWMGNKDVMLKRIKEKIRSGFSCIKLKIGAINFEDELSLISFIRSKFSVKDLELRVDANGAFSFNEALKKIERLSHYNIHSIEQPIKAGNIEEMAALCCRTALPIALDEELIGINDKKNKVDLLDIIAPQYIILKPSLTGGFCASDEWIEIAESKNIGWWATSALESNIGLNAIAQWCFTKNVNMPQGLGTGKVFTNNLPSNLNLAGELLYTNNHKDSLTLKCFNKLVSK